jgi:uncharacterized protein (DUF302 family)
MPVPTIAGVISQPSPYGVDETLQKLEQVIQSRGLTVFARFDHSDEATRVGLTMQPAHVLVFGSPRAGTPLMNASPLIALELPLRTLVWQDRDARVWVSFADSSYLAERFAIPGELAAVLGGPQNVVQAALGG